jgi:sugar phosphate isomerase/epimerase
MKHAIAIWNFGWESGEVLRRLDDCAAWGFDVISFHPRQLLEMTAEGRRFVADKAQDLGFGITLHGNCDLTKDEISTTAALFGDRLQAYSFDAAMTSDPRGYVYNVGRIAQVLAWAEEITAEARAQFGMEDFPLDTTALDFSESHLDRFLDNPRYGILVDLGHMHLRMSEGGYFGDMTPTDYLAHLPVPLFELHVHDNDGRRDQHKHLGDGTLSFGAAAGGVKAAGFDGISTIEVAPALHDGDPEAEWPRIPMTFETWKTLLTDA